jgi:hypothetical protein
MQSIPDNRITEKIMIRYIETPFNNITRIALKGEIFITQNEINETKPSLLIMNLKLQAGR